MTKTYLITLTPTGKFFFGGDMTFAAPGVKEEFTSYIIRSNKFPQQTSLLGMLRFLILRNNDAAFDVDTQTIKCKDKAKELIGPKSFEPSGCEGDFGKITSIYSCFLQKDGKPIGFLEWDYKYNVLFKETKGQTNRRKSLDIPSIEGYNPKDGIASLYLVEGVEVPESDIFVEDWRIGINRDITTGKTEDNALYKQVSYRLNDKCYKYDCGKYHKDRERKKDSDKKDVFTPCQYQFAFYAEVDEEVGLTNYNGQLVQVGADSSQFVIGIEERKRPDEKSQTGNTVVLTSPAYLTKEDLSDVRFAITDTIPFKYMKTETDNIKSYNKRNHLYEYSDKMYLYATGSVFYFKTNDEAEAFAQNLKGHADFYQIGYNHFRIK